MFRSVLVVAPTVVVLTVVATCANAQPAGVADSPWQVSVQGGVVQQFDSDLEDGGEYSVTRANIELGVGCATGPRDSVGLSLGYTIDDYSFDGPGGLAALEPWGEIREYQLALSLRRGIGERIDLFALPTLRWSAEKGGDLSDGLTPGLIAGFNYRVSDRLRIGPGFGLFDEIEDGVTAFPILLIDWKITDTLSLETGSGMAATRGPGLQLNSTAIEDWTLSLGARYETYRFRLDDDGPVPDGVGEEEAVLAYLAASYEVNPTIRFSALAGLELGGKLTLEDMNGRRIRQEDADPAPFIGLTFRARF